MSFYNFLANGGVGITPSDSDDLSGIGYGLFIGGGGDVRVLTSDGSDLTFTNIPDASVLNVKVVRVYATNTTATNIIAFRGWK